ncbi:hypothetical protein [Komagataeibacter xylinus]|uniref:hypothetical protein n=1 Tax=Komagataeibacter xylinus TaxID=28448 RepID=UPI001F10EBFC|nr:hypothetical protein [Komagataeibacter xylinus]
MTRESVAVPCRLQINGQNSSADLPPSVTLLDLLRERLDLTGTKKGGRSRPMWRMASYRMTGTARYLAPAP